MPNKVYLNGNENLKPASGENPNPFFTTVKVKDPLISVSANLNPVNPKPTFLYDFPTTAGKIYTIVCKE